MKVTWVSIAILLVVLVVLAVAAPSIGRPRPDPEDPRVIRSEGYFSYDGNVYYFDEAKDFGPKLAWFIQHHPDLRVVSIAALDTGGYGSTRGYWVVVEKRELPKGAHE